MGRWSAQHRKIAIFGWLAFVAAAVVLGNAIGTKELRAAELGVGESGRMMKLLDKEFPEPAGERILIQSPTLTARSDEFKAVVGDVVGRLKPQKDVINIRSPLDEANFNLISDDGHSALIDFQIAGDVDAASDKVQPIVDSVTAAQAAHPDFVVAQFGDASVDKEFDETFAKDLERAGLLSVPVTLIILIVAFGALVAAGIPLLLALSAVLATMGLLAIPSQLLAVDAAGVGAVVLLIGLAVGVDYSMFYLKREREERAAGNDSDSALQAAAATSGRSVLISGVTVMIAMSGMFFTGDRTFMGMAMGTILVVAVAVLGSLTVLPALLSKLGDNVERLHVPLIGRLQKKNGEGRIWSAILGPVLRYPVVFALLAGGFMLALGAFTLQMKPAQPGPDAFPQDMKVMQAYNKMQTAFPGGAIPLDVVVKADNVTSGPVREAIGQIGWRAIDSGVMHEPILIDFNKAGTVAKLSIPIEGPRNRRNLGSGADRRCGRRSSRTLSVSPPRSRTTA